MTGPAHMTGIDWGKPLAELEARGARTLIAPTPARWGAEDEAQLAPVDGWLVMQADRNDPVLLSVDSESGDARGIRLSTVLEWVARERPDLLPSVVTAAQAEAGGGIDASVARCGGEGGR